MGQSIKTYDVVIVGGGVIGGALALALSRLNYNVALLDKKTPSFSSTNPERVIALSAGSVSYLESLAVWQAIKAFGAGHIKDIVVCESGGTARVDMSCRELGDGVVVDALGYVLEIRHVLQSMYQEIEGNVDVLCPAQCLSYEQTKSGVLLQVQTEQGVERIEAGLLVGADGTQSHIRKILGIQNMGWDHNRMAIVASVQTTYPHGDVAYECFCEEGPLALLPLADKRFSLVWSVAPAKGVALMKMKDASFLKALEIEVGLDVFEKTGCFQALGQRVAFPLGLSIAKSFAKNGALLVGNAAHTVHPIAGQGMNLGLRDVAVLANILKQDWARKDLTSPLILQTYAERRRWDVMAVAGFTEGVLEVFGGKSLLLRWLRGKGLQSTQSVSALKQLLLAQAAGVGQLKGFNQ